MANESACYRITKKVQQLLWRQNPIGFWYLNTKDTGSYRFCQSMSLKMVWLLSIVSATIYGLCMQKQDVNNIS